MGLIQNAVSYIARGRAVFGLFRESKPNVTVRGKDDLLDALEDAIVNASLYGEAFETAKLDRKRVAAATFERAVVRLAKAREYKVRDEGQFQSAVTEFVGAAYDVFECLEADEDKVAVDG